MNRRLTTLGERDSVKRRAGIEGPYRIAAELMRNTRSFGYGFLAQVFSAATNFGLVVIAGRVLGPGGLGTVLLGFAAYILLLGFQRALLSEPLIAASSGREPSEMILSARAAITLGLVSSIAAAAILAALGFGLSTRLGRGMLLFAPWLVAALVQDLGRSIVFRDRTKRNAVFSDATWLVTMATAAPFAFSSGSDWAVVGCWGAGALAGGYVALRQLRWRPVGLASAVAWWRSEARRLATWLGAQALLYNVASYVTVLLLAGILGASDYGGFRAVQSVFAPLTLLGPALALPGLPLVSRLHTDAPKRAFALSAELAALITVVTTAYVVVLYAFPDALVLLFGHEFADFDSIIIPIGVAQILIAPTFALALFLKAGERGRTLLWAGGLYAIAYLVLTVALGLVFGLTGAAWGAAGAGVVGTAAVAFALRPSTWAS